MKKLLFLLTLIFGLQLGAQNDEAYVDKLVGEFTGKLENRGISNWFSSKRFCTGTVEMFQIENGRMCTSKGTYYEVYVVWEEEGTAMIKKIDNCGLFYSIPLNNKKLLDMVNDNYTDLQLNSVKPYNGEKTTGKPVSRTSVQPCKRSFIFTKEEGEMKQTYNLYDLTTSMENPNANYEYNKGLTIVALDNKLDEVIAALQTKFKRQ
jgi:hypothetical protein